MKETALLSPPSNSREKFLGMVAPATLLAQVESTAPFFADISEESLELPKEPTPLIDLAGHPLGFLRILKQAARSGLHQASEQAEHLDYFALCLACHHGTVATYVPTDVDSKIRGALWYQHSDPDTLSKMFQCSYQAMSWSLEGFSTRCTELAGVGPVSGHNGEMLGVLAGALGAFVSIDRVDLAQEVAEVIDIELEREAKEFNFVRGKKGLEVELLCVAASLTHNLGDLDQGIGYWKSDDPFTVWRDRYSDFNHKHAEAFQGAYAACLKLYKAIMSSEGHRHYPLREVKALRRDARLLLPLSPFLDEWGSKVARSDTLTSGEKSEVLSQLLQGCKRISNQVGYYRALVGMQEELGGRFQILADQMPKSSRTILKEAKVQQQLAVSRASFEASIRKKVAAVLS